MALTEKESKELDKLSKTRCFGGVDRRYKRWTKELEARFQLLLAKDRETSN